MNYKKIAQIFKSSADFMIWRKSENEYWLTNTYFLIKLDKETFNKVKAKYSSYKNKPCISELESFDGIELLKAQLAGDNS